MKSHRWVQPPELAQYDQYTNYPGRAEELVNHGASVFANAVVAIMRAEMGAQYDLLARLRSAGLLADSGQAAGDDLREMLRYALARAERMDSGDLQPHDFQRHVDNILATMITWETRRASDG